MSLIKNTTNKFAVIAKLFSDNQDYYQLFDNENEAKNACKAVLSQEFGINSTEVVSPNQIDEDFHGDSQYLEIDSNNQSDIVALAKQISSDNKAKWEDFLAKNTGKSVDELSMPKAMHGYNQK